MRSAVGGADGGTDGAVKRIGRGGGGIDLSGGRGILELRLLVDFALLSQPLNYSEPLEIVNTCTKTGISKTYRWHTFGSLLTILARRRATRSLFRGALGTGRRFRNRMPKRAWVSHGGRRPITCAVIGYSNVLLPLARCHSACNAGVGLWWCRLNFVDTVICSWMGARASHAAPHK